MRPLRKTLPASGRSAPTIIFNRVDLPVPFSPTIPTMLPLGTVRLVFTRMLFPANHLTIPVTSRGGVIIGLGRPVQSADVEISVDRDPVFLMQFSAQEAVKVNAVLKHGRDLRKF